MTEGDGVEEEIKAAERYLRQRFAEVIQQADAGVITDAKAAAYMYREIRALLTDGHKTAYVKQTIRRRALAVQVVIDIVNQFDIKAPEIFNKRTWAQ